MKKKILAIALASLSLTACAGGENNDKSKDSTSKTESVDPSDTLAVDYGKLTGHIIGKELAQYAEQTGTPYDTKEFAAGVEYVLSQKRSEAFMAGMSTGLNMMAELNRFAEGGFNLNRATVVANFKATVDSPLDEATQEAAYQRVSEMGQKAQQAVLEKEEAAKAAGPEAIQNEKTGEALVAKAIKDEPNAVTTPSGLVYIIRQEGSGDTIGADDDVEVKYAGSHLDGKVFDANTATFKPSQTVPGFKEGLMKLKKGSKARLYVPGKLGYGANGAPAAGIGPMETLVFDVEILNVKPSK